MAKTQLKVLEFILSKSRDGRLIISESDLKKQIEKSCGNINFHLILKQLEREEFIQVIYTDRHGEPFIYIILLSKTTFYFKEKKARRKEVYFKLLLAVISAIITFILGRVLYALFN